MSSNPQSPNRLDGLLRKYTYVWLWSILFGVSVGTTFSLANTDLRRPWGELSPLPIALSTLAVIFAAGLWWHLYRYLAFFLIPIFFLGYDPVPDTSTEIPFEEAESRLRKPSRGAAASLRFAFQYLMFAIFVRLLLALTQQVFEALRATSL